MHTSTISVYRVVVHGLRSKSRDSGLTDRPQRVGVAGAAGWTRLPESTVDADPG